MRLTIAENDNAPIYLQIVNQVKLLVSSGRLKPDDELPSIRALAEQLLVNPNTVARAYRELEMAGIIFKKRATGCFVSPAAAEIGTAERLELLTEKADTLLAQSIQLGISFDDLTAFLLTRNSLIEVTNS